MISKITVIHKRADLTASVFEEKLANEVSAEYLKVPALHGYEQNYVFLKEKGDAYSENVTADAITIERYETLHDYEVAVGSAQYANSEAALRKIADGTEAYVCLENISIPYEGDGKCKKKISLLGRTVPKVSFEDYTREWLVVHSGCMIKMPKDIFFGYNQHLIIDHIKNGEHVAYEELPFDGILELYFSDPQAVSNAFATTPEGQLTVTHRKEFMSSVNPFQVTFKVFQ